MARTLDSSIVTQLGNEAIRIVHLIDIQLSTPLRITNHVKDLTYNSYTYTAGGNLIDIQTVNESGDLEYQNINIRLNNISDALRTTLQAENYIDSAASVYVVFLNANETIIEAYKSFSGTLAYASLLESKGDTAVKMELANQWKNWDIVKGRKYTDTSQQNVYSGDKGLAFAHTTNEDVRWNR